MTTSQQLKLCVDHIRDAAGKLRELEHLSQKNKDYGMAGSCDHYAAALEEVLSSDKGESGLESLMAIIAKMEARS